MANLKSLLGVGAGVVVAHNLEEALTAPAWFIAHSAELQARFGRAIPTLSGGALLVALAVVTALSLAWIAAARHSSSHSLGAYSLIVLFGMYLANAAMPHIFGTLVLGQYVPGVLTASLAVIPFTFLFLVHGIRTKRYTTAGVCIALTIAIVIYVCLGVLAQSFL